MLNFIGGKLHETKVSGQFWIVGETGPKFSGRLEIDRLGSSTLVLQGRRADLRALERDKNFDIHGLASDTQVTLFDCFTGTAGLAIEMSGQATIVVNFTLVGEHVPSLDARHFDAVEISPDGLSAWTELRGYSERIKSVERFSIKYKDAKARPVKLSYGTTLQFRTRPILFTNPEGRREFVDSNVMRLEFSGNKSVVELLHQESIWRNFISLALRKPAIVPWSNLEAGKKRFVLLKSSHEPEGEKVRPLFTRRYISSRMSRALRTWSDKYENLEPVISLHIGVLFQSRMHLSFQFLAYAQALEVLHRRTRPNKQIFRKATFKKIRIALGKAIPDRYRGKSRLVDKFAFLNEITLADRLSELYRAESVLIKGLFPHEADLIAVKNIRNYLTHFSGTKTAKFERYMQTREFMILTRKMRILIEIFLLKEMGLGGAVRAIVSTNADYKWLCQEAHGIPE
jgi:hypothetical protein